MDERPRARRPHRRGGGRSAAPAFGVTPAQSDANDAVPSRRLGVQLSRIEIDPRVNPARSRPVPPNAGESFEQKQDYLTFADDLFWDDDGQTVRMIGPPRPSEIDIAFRTIPGHTGCSGCFEEGTERFVDRYRIVVPPGTTALEITFGEQRIVTAIQPNLSSYFEGRRALMAISRDNPLQWIVDWAQFHAFHHGVDAVVLYDNMSTAYAPGDISRALHEVPGIAIHAVIPWLTRYGDYTVEAIGHWGQRSALDHAAHRLLKRAEWVINADIDELLLPGEGVTIDDLMATHSASSIQFPRVNVVAIDEHVKPGRRHLDFSWTRSGGNFKSVIRPSRLLERARLYAHGIQQGRQRQCNQLRIAHFLPLTTGWRHDWRLGGRSTTDPGVSHDDQLREALDAALRDGPVAPSPWTPLEGQSAGLARIEAERLAAAGDLRGALAMIEHAIVLEPDDLRHRKWREELLASRAGDNDTALSAGDAHG